MSGKILKISSNDLYGNVDDRKAIVYACFEHTKYMNNYIVFSFEGDAKDKLCYGSVHLKKDSLVVFNIKENEKKYVDVFLDEYLNDSLNDYKVLKIDNMQKVELVSYDEMEYDKIELLDDKSIKRETIKVEEVVKEKKHIILYVLLLCLILLAVGLTALYFMPEKFSAERKALECNGEAHDDVINLNYVIEKDIIFNTKNKVKSIDVIRTYNFYDVDSYNNFKINNEQNKYFTNGEGYKYYDGHLMFRLFYEEDSVIDDYDEMLSYLKKEGYTCIEKKYEE